MSSTRFLHPSKPWVVAYVLSDGTWSLYDNRRDREQIGWSVAGYFSAERRAEAETPAAISERANKLFIDYDNGEFDEEDE